MTEWTLSSYHKPKYGDWAGRFAGFPADPNNCAKEIYSERHHYQCSRKRGHGPEGAFCKQHNPEAVEARRRKADLEGKIKGWQRYHRAASLGTLGQLLLDHLDQKCSFDDVEAAAHEHRRRAAEIEQLKGE